MKRIEIEEVMMFSLGAVVLAAGKGKRMKSSLPKVLLPVLGRPMLFYVLDNLAFVSEVVVVGGYGFDELERHLQGYPMACLLARQEKQLGTADAAKAGLSALGDSEYVVIACGDMPLIRQEYIESLAKEVVSQKALGGLLYAKTEEKTSLGRVFFKDDKVEKIVEASDIDEKDTACVNTGLYVVQRAFLESALEGVSNDNRQGEFYLTDIVSQAYQKGQPFLARECPFKMALGANSRRDLADIEKFLLNEKIGSLLDKGISILKPESVYIEWDVEIGEGTTILPFTVIRRDVKIGKACQIGPFAHIRPKSIIGDNACVGDFVEVNRTEFKSGAQAKHLAYLGDATIGEKANIGAGVITANYDGRAKHKTEIGKNAFIGSGAILVAPCEVQETGILGAGAVLTKGKKVGKGEVFIGVPAREQKKGVG